MGSLLNVLTYSGEEAAVVGGLLTFLVIFMVFMMLILGVTVILAIIGQWKLFEKANEGGWKALIPFYNIYTHCKIVGVSPWWILIVFGASFIQMLLQIPNSDVLNIIAALIAVVNWVASIYFTILLAVSTARSYGKDTGWAVGLVLLAPFFTFALGVSKAEYVGATPMNDPILGSTVGSSNASGNTKFCPECGAKIDANSKFCPKCGKKI